MNCDSSGIDSPLSLTLSLEVVTPRRGVEGGKGHDIKIELDERLLATTIGTRRAAASTPLLLVVQFALHFVRTSVAAFLPSSYIPRIAPTNMLYQSSNPCALLISFIAPFQSLSN